MTLLPSRCADILTREVGAETVAVDPASNKAHALTPLASSVYALCDGRSTVADAARALAVSEADVENVVVTLTALGLVSGPGLTRRRALQRAGLIGGGALAVTIGAPLAAQASSAGNPRTPRGSLDGYTNFAVVDTTLLVPAGSTITGFTYYAQQAGTIYFFTYQGGSVVQVTSNMTVSANTSGTYPVSNWSVMGGGVNIGFGVTTNAVIPYDASGKDTIQYTANNSGKVVAGKFTAAGTDVRTYSFGANY